MTNILLFRIFASSLFFSLASCLLTGFSFGVGNNIFHLPIIFQLFDLDQFKDDLFIQSLRYYSSGFWHVLSGAHCFLDIKALFLFLFIFSRFIFFCGFFLCCSLFSSLAWRDFAFLGFFALLMPFLYGMSFAGGGGLFINSFTHSELANGLVLIFSYFVALRKFGSALAINGLCFFVNCFMAIWGFLPLAILFLRDTFHANNCKSFLKSGFLGFIIFVLFSYPVVRNILINPYIHTDLTFSFQKYLLFYWPYHSFAQSIPFFEYLKLCNIIIITFFCFSSLGKMGKIFINIFGLYFFVYLLGFCLSFFLPSIFVLNCHLLRSSVVFHLAASIAIANYLFALVNNRNIAGAKLLSSVSLLMLLNDVTSFFVVPLIILYQRKYFSFLNSPDAFRLKRTLTILSFLFLSLYWSFFAVKNLVKSSRLNSRIDDLIELSKWIRKNTLADSVFIFPTVNFNEQEICLLTSQPFPDRGFTDFSVFQSFAERRVYVDFKRGAAVMWCPDYFFEWKPRVDSILRYTNLNDLVYFATIEKIPYIIYDLTRYPDVPAFYKTRYFGLIKVF